jgi:hypothetical protein
MLHPESEWTVVAVCRRSDPDRAPRFYRAVELLNARGLLGDLDDGPEQFPLTSHEVQNTVLELLPSGIFDLVITHGIRGEYTRHLRHEETGKAVFALWSTGRMSARQVWRFAYEDGGGLYLPRAVQDADVRIELPNEIWQRKYDIITEIYGFAPDSFEAKTVPRQEAFWCFKRK